MHIPVQNETADRPITEPIPVERRLLSGFDVAILWSNMGVSLLGIVAGAGLIAYGTGSTRALIAILIGGAVVTESVFGLPGLGRLTVEAVLSRDFPTIQTVILLFSVVYVVVNLLIDISYTLFDPRIRY